MKLNEWDEMDGVYAVSLVDKPAIESDWITLSEEEIKLAKVDEEQRILLGAALIPNKPILRVNEKGEHYHIFFSKDTVKKAAHLFLKRGNQSNGTFEHDFVVNGVSVVESWITNENDKSKSYGLDLPLGSWVIMMKIDDNTLWDNYVKTGKINGFSIEGKFSNPQSVDLSTDDVELESYGGYPDSASNNAKLGIKRNKELGNKCATQTGKVRAQQLVRKEKFTLPTLKRIHSYLSRAESYYDPSKPDACGTISYLLWGGKSMKNWVESKLKGLDELKSVDFSIEDVIREAYDN